MPPKWSSRLRIPLSSMRKKHKKTEPFLGSGHFSGSKAHRPIPVFAPPPIYAKNTKKNCLFLGQNVFWSEGCGSTRSRVHCSGASSKGPIPVFAPPLFFLNINNSENHVHSTHVCGLEFLCAPSVTSSTGCRSR